MKDTKETLEYIKTTGMTAKDLLHYDVSPKIEKKFFDAIKKLESAIKEVRKDFPDANICVDGEVVTFNIGTVQDIEDFMMQIRAGAKDKVMNTRPQLIAFKYSFHSNYLTTGVL